MITGAAQRAADWLEANPDKHMDVHLAVDTSGLPCKPTDPEAECFCALGRLAYELGAPSYFALHELNIRTWPIHSANDRLIRNADGDLTHDRQGGIRALRRLSHVDPR